MACVRFYVITGHGLGIDRDLKRFVVRRHWDPTSNRVLDDVLRDELVDQIAIDLLRMSPGVELVGCWRIFPIHKG